MGDTACIQLIGLGLGFVGVLLFSWGEVGVSAELVAYHRRRDPALDNKLRNEGWFRRIPLRWVSPRRTIDVTTLDDPIREALPPKFWGLVLIGLGFLLQVMAVVV